MNQIHLDLVDPSFIFNGFVDLQNKWKSEKYIRESYYLFYSTQSLVFQLPRKFYAWSQLCDSSKKDRASLSFLMPCRRLFLYTCTMYYVITDAANKMIYWMHPYNLTLLSYAQIVLEKYLCSVLVSNGAMVKGPTIGGLARTIFLLMPIHWSSNKIS